MDYQPIGESHQHQQEGAFEGQSYQQGGFVAQESERSGLLVNQQHYQGFGSSEDYSLEIQDSKVALAIYGFFFSVIDKIRSTLWLWPICLTIAQILGVILVMITGKTTLLYVVGGIGLAPCIGGMFAYYYAPSIPTARHQKDPSNNVIIYTVEFSKGNFFWDCVKCLHIGFSFLITFASGAGGIGGFVNILTGPEPNEPKEEEDESGGLGVSSALGICWFILSIATYGLYLHYSYRELLFQFIWQKIKRTTLTEALVSTQDPSSRHALMSLLKVNPKYNYIYEPAAATAADDKNLPGVFDEQPLEIYVNPTTCCGCIQDGESIMDVNKNRATQAVITGCYPCCCGSISYSTMWFEHVPSISFFSLGTFLSCNSQTFGQAFLSVITCIPWIFLCSCFVTNPRTMSMASHDSSASHINFTVNMSHVAPIRSVFVRAISAWRVRRFPLPSQI